MDLTHYFPNSTLIDDTKYDNILNSLRKSKTTTSELLLSSTESISKKSGKREDELNEIIIKLEEETKLKIKKSFYSPLINNKSEQENSTYFTVGDEFIDKALNGGIPIGYLVEISGKSASGKTNFLLTLCITIQLPIEFGGLGASIFSSGNSNSDTNVKTLYIPTESSLATQRLEQIIEHFSNLLETNGISRNNSQFFPKLDNVITTSNIMSNLEEQDHILKYQLPVILSRDSSIKLVILDSLTHHLRVQLPGYKHAEYIKTTCTYLKKLAKKFNITIIIANQVTDKPVNGIYSEKNNLSLKLNTEYQLGWMSGWDDVGIIYRHSMRRQGLIDEANKSFERLDYLDEIQSGDYSNYTNNNEYPTAVEDGNNTSFKDIKNILKNDRKRLFDSSYKVKVSGIGTRPSLGLPLLNFIDMRIVLSKEYAPILNENLIGEFSEELGLNTEDDIDEINMTNTSTNSDVIETSTQISNNESKNVENKKILTSLYNNNYLKNYNFQSFRRMKCVFGPLIPAGETGVVDFEIWKGGLRKYNS